MRTTSVSAVFCLAAACFGAQDAAMAQVRLVKAGQGHHSNADPAAHAGVHHPRDMSGLHRHVGPRLWLGPSRTAQAIAPAPAQAAVAPWRPMLAAGAIAASTYVVMTQGWKAFGLEDAARRAYAEAYPQPTATQVERPRPGARIIRIGK